MNYRLLALLASSLLAACGQSAQSVPPPGTELLPAGQVTVPCSGMHAFYTPSSITIKSVQFLDTTGPISYGRIDAFAAMPRKAKMSPATPLKEIAHWYFPVDPHTRTSQVTGVNILIPPRGFIAFFPVDALGRSNRVTCNATIS